MGGTPGDPGTPISVALASFNGAGFIAARWDSFAAQTRLPDELVVCDDVSSAIWIIAACTSFACTGDGRGKLVAIEGGMPTVRLRRGWRALYESTILDSSEG